MFEVGEKIICVNEDPFVLIDDFVFSNKGITENKEYEVIQSYPNSTVLIRNNANALVACKSKLFVSKSMFRKMKIRKIRKKQSLTYRICTKLGIK
jgi:hypothetical protein